MQSLFYFKMFQRESWHLRCLCPLWQRWKKAIWRNLWSVQNEAISLVSVRSKELWLVEEDHATVKPAVKPDSSVASREMKTYRESRIKLRNLQILKPNAGKIKSVFVIGAALWAKKLGHCLENCRSWKNTLGKLCGRGQPRGHLIRVLNVRSVNDGGVLCLLWFSNQFNIVSETYFSYDAVGHEL